MVRIVNGEIVDEIKVSRPAVSYTSPPKYYQLFPSTGGFFGVFSRPLHIIKLEIEVLWLLSIFITGYLFGFKSLAIFIVVLLILSRNMKYFQAKKSHINTLN
jgi:hypothetical protein